MTNAEMRESPFHDIPFNTDGYFNLSVEIVDDANSFTRTGHALKNKSKFAIVEDIEENSNLYQSEIKVRVTIRLNLEYKPSKFTAGPYCLDVWVRQQHLSHYGLSEIGARELACRLLLRHVKGITPILH